MKYELTDKLIDDRAEARANNDWSLSDQIRNELDSRNCFIFDSKDGQIVYHMTKNMSRNEMIACRKQMDFNFKIGYIKFH